MRIPLVSVRMAVVMTVLLGAAYPAVVLLVGESLFPFQAEGSIVSGPGGTAAGSALLAQKTLGPGLFRPRPSAADFKGDAGAGSNLGPTSAALATAVSRRAVELQSADSGSAPAELLYASGSGLDPDLTVQGAAFQVPRIASERGVPASEIADLVARNAEAPLLGFIGPVRVNALKLNLELEKRFGKTAAGAVEKDGL